MQTSDRLQTKVFQTSHWGIFMRNRSFSGSFAQRYSFWPFVSCVSDKRAARKTISSPESQTFRGKSGSQHRHRTRGLAFPARYGKLGAADDGFLEKLSLSKNDVKQELRARSSVDFATRSATAAATVASRKAWPHQTLHRLLENPFRSNKNPACTATGSCNPVCLLLCDSLNNSLPMEILLFTIRDQCLPFFLAPSSRINIRYDIPCSHIHLILESRTQQIFPIPSRTM